MPGRKAPPNRNGELLVCVVLGTVVEGTTTLGYGLLDGVAPEEDAEERTELDELLASVEEGGSVICPRNAIRPSIFRSPSGRSENSLTRWIILQNESNW